MNNVQKYIQWLHVAGVFCRRGGGGVCDKLYTLQNF